MTAVPQQRALVICYSQLVTDPRVVRQIDWLVESGWSVDTLGFGPGPRETVSEHFELREPHGIGRSTVIRSAAHVLLPHRLRFNFLMGSRVPRNLLKVGAKRYDLIVTNDIDLLPWVTKAAPALLSSRPDAHVHLDVHEYHDWHPEQSVTASQAKILGRYHAWTRRHIADPIYATRSTVAEGIAQLYADEFGFTEPAVVRNSPDYRDIRPSTVDPKRIELVYHGNAEMARGLDLLIDAFRLTDPRFHLTLMLTGSEAGKVTLKRSTRDLGDRVSFVAPVPMNRVADRINEFDLEVIFYPPTSPNYLFSFPNKFFESVQGRVGVVIGESPSMKSVVEEYGNGVVVEGWEATDLAHALNALTPEDVASFKRGADGCARDLNAATERFSFLTAIGMPAK